MTSIIFRRPGLGNTSTMGVQESSTTGLRVQTHRRIPRVARREGEWPVNPEYVFRWGCTATIPVDHGTVVNTARAIHQVNDKIGFRRLIADNPDTAHLCPDTWYTAQDCINQGMPADGVVVRPRNHAQGRNFHVIYDEQDLINICERYGADNYYISELIIKSAEYRVFVCQGRAVWVARKTPGNPDQVAWNVARGGRFDHVRWGDWPLRVVRAAIEAFNCTDLDFGGVDVMVDAYGRAYVVEINSAPSQTSPHRQECVARAFDYIVRNGKQRISLIEERGGWRKFIHPGVSNEAQLV